MKYLLSFILIIHYSCFNINQSLEPGEGYVNVKGGRIWYKIVGNGEGIPLLVIHGGPGGRSCGSMSGYSLLADETPVIFYDQLGSGNSDRPTDTTLWRLERFVNEIDELRKHLGLKKLHILGHSWGGTVLAEYMLTKKTEGVQSVIFSSPLISTPVWMNDAKILLAQLPKNIQDTITKYEDLKKYTDSSYIAATDTFYSRFLSVKQWPPASKKDCDSVPKFNEQVYNYMWGPTEFNATGTLKNFDRAQSLNTIKQPIIFIAGKFDEARPETMYEFQKLVPHAKVEIIEGAAHSTAIDQPGAYTIVIRKFLKNIESKKK